MWSIICTLTGKPDEPPSEKSMKKMELGWKKFFKAFGLEYVGEGMNIKLRSPLWLILMPLTATLAAFAAEFGLVTLFKKEGETPAKIDEKTAA